MFPAGRLLQSPSQSLHALAQSQADAGANPSSETSAVREAADAGCAAAAPTSATPPMTIA
jgi:hypothetical protein